MTLLTLLMLHLVLPWPHTDDSAHTENSVHIFEDRTLEQWKKVVSPGEEEIWLTIPWQTSLHQGLKKSADESKPLLLWLMNGHPLGCT